MSNVLTRSTTFSNLFALQNGKRPREEDAYTTQEENMRPRKYQCAEDSSSVETYDETSSYPSDSSNSEPTCHCNFEESYSE